MNLSSRRESYAEIGLNPRRPISLVLLLLTFAVGPARLLRAQHISETPATAASSNEVASFGQLSRLTKEEATAGLMVKIKAVVLCYDPGWGQLYLKDPTEIRWLSPLSFQRALAPGDLVEIRGATRLIEGFPGLTNLQAEVLGHQELPPPVSCLPPPWNGRI